MRKVAVHGGGTPLKICDVASVVAATWSGNGDIVFATAVQGNGCGELIGRRSARALTTRSRQRVSSSTLIRRSWRTANGCCLSRRADTSQPAILTTELAPCRSAAIRFESGGALYTPTGHLIYTRRTSWSPSPTTSTRTSRVVRSFPFRNASGDTTPCRRAVCGRRRIGSLVYVPDRT